MTGRIAVGLVALAALLDASRSVAAPFVPGDVVVYRVGDGAGALVNTGNPVYLDEYTTGGTLVQSLALPTSASGPTHQLVASGVAQSEGQLTRSADGRYLVLTGYASDLPGAAALSGTPAATVPRTVGRVGADGSVDTTTALTDFADANNPRGAASTDGTQLWAGGGAGGVRAATLGAATSTQLGAGVVNVRAVNVFAGQLYLSTQAGSGVRVGTVGSGTPTTGGQTITNLPGFPTTGSPDAFFFADLDGTPGVDTLYVADDAAGILKFCLVGGSWVARGAAGTGSDAYRGLTAFASGGAITVLATRKGGGGPTGGGDLVRLVDASGWNGTLVASPARIAQTAPNTAFRGVALAPVVPRVDLPSAETDAYSTPHDTPLTVGAAAGLLANDTGSPLTIVTSTPPAHGSVSIGPDGSFTYTPDPGYGGPDGFTYTVSDAVQLFRTQQPPLATFGGVAITGAGWGSSLTPVPGSATEVYGLTDSGPQESSPGGTHVAPLPFFAPSIAKFQLQDGIATLETVIPLADAGGGQYFGLINAQHPTGETLYDMNGVQLAPQANGYDSEGLVALADGTFWVSDEYGPYITHFDATGRALARLSPLDASLPAELARREPGRGLEGLAITPDGSTLVAIMQSALVQSDLGLSDPHDDTVVRIVTYVLATGALHEYVYLLDDPAARNTVVSEIAALSGTTFLVDERDSQPPPAAYKKVWAIDLATATDIGPSSTVPGATYTTGSGLLIGGHTLEALVIGQDTATARATLIGQGITPVTKQLYLDVGGVLDALDAQGRFFAHDKVEGLAVLDGGAKLALSNDSDFGIDGIVNDTPPFQLHAKVSPATGAQDDGEYLIVDLGKLPVVTSSASVSLSVTGPTPVPTATVTPTPTATPNPGYVPGTKDARTCEDGGAKNLSKLAKCIRTCHAKQADLALKSGAAVDGTACEHGASGSCRSKYDAAAAKLVAKGICPACLGATAEGNVADQLASALEGEETAVYCAGSIPIGGAEGGVVPPDKGTSKCEDGAMKAAGKLGACTATCRVKNADAAFKGASFDVDACALAGAKSCRAKFDATSTHLDQDGTCPSCLDDPTRQALADAIAALLEQSESAVYCDPTSGQPLP